LLFGAVSLVTIKIVTSVPVFDYAPLNAPRIHPAEKFTVMRPFTWVPGYVIVVPAVIFEQLFPNPLLSLHVFTLVPELNTS